MNAEARRKAILDTLNTAEQPVSAAKLAAELSVSRQIIVGDIALLRAAGYEIEATPRGYVIPRAHARLIRRIACRHTSLEMRAELYAMVDEGCIVQDVIVEHSIYGQLTGLLDLSSRHEVDEFIERCRTAERESRPLSTLTDGIHLHTLSCPDEASLERVKEKLRAMNILL